MDRVEDNAEQGAGSVVAVIETVLLLVTICVALIIGWRIDKKLQQRRKRGGRHRR